MSFSRFSETLGHSKVNDKRIMFENKIFLIIITLIYTKNDRISCQIAIQSLIQSSKPSGD